MAYKTYELQVAEHLQFLRAEGLDVNQLKIGNNWNRTREIGKHAGRGELVYKTQVHLLDNGMNGLATWCRGKNGQKNFSTYGYPAAGSDVAIPRDTLSTNEKLLSDLEKHEEAACKANAVWDFSDISGKSDYLDEKKVGTHGIRFRRNEYGNVAVVPLRDIAGSIWNYQFLNPDGTKRFAKDARIEGLFHTIGVLQDGKVLGVSESYATAATVHELIGIGMICAFSCNNLFSAAQSIQNKYPNSEILFFADNDRHLLQNNGLLKATQAAEKIAGARVVTPQFADIPPGKDASDWNDLVRLIGEDEVKGQLQMIDV